MKISKKIIIGIGCQKESLGGQMVEDSAFRALTRTFEFLPGRNTTDFLNNKILVFPQKTISD